MSYWWVPLTILFYCFHAYLSFRNKGATEAGSFLLVWVVGACFPIWAVITRFSKNLMLDGLIFDVCLTLSYAVTFAILEQRTLSPLNVAGVVVIVVGLVMVKI